MKTLAKRCRQLVQQRFHALGFSSDQSPACGLSNETCSNGLNDLLIRVKNSGFDAVLEQEVGVWFNRFCALRFMEVHGYLNHQLRIFSHPENSGFEILNHALDIVDDLELDRTEIEYLKLSGTQDENLYRRLLLAQCQQLHQWLPFLFPAAGDSSYLLLPDNLIRSDSLIRILVDDLPDDYWRDLSIINELYNVYIGFSGTTPPDRKDPGSQLYTNPPTIPQWLARSMVENSLGRLWQQRHTDPGLEELFDYFIPEQPVGESVSPWSAAASNTPNPETLKILDPFCGSGIFLAEAYRLLREIYLQCGYRKRDIPALILEKNLFGLVFDSHSEQVSKFLLMMAARADDRRFFDRVIGLNVHLLKGSIPSEQAPFQNEALLQRSSHVGSLGYLLRDSGWTTYELQEMRGRYDDKDWSSLLDQIVCLQRTYDVIVTRPPAPQKTELPATSWQHQLSSPDFGTVHGNGFGIDDRFSDKCLTKLKPGGFAAILGRDDWMLKSQYQSIRDDHYQKRTLVCLQHIGAGLIERGNRLSATVFRNKQDSSTPCQFLYLDRDSFDNNTQLPTDWRALLTGVVSLQPQQAFNDLPDRPMAYWVSDAVRAAFRHPLCLGDNAGFMKRAPTLDRERFLRLWHEVDFSRTFAGKEIAHQWNLYATGQSMSPWSADLRWVAHVRAGIPKLTLDACCISIQGGVSAIQLPEGATYSSTTGYLLADQDQVLGLVGTINSTPFQEMTAVFGGVTGTESLSQGQIASIPICDTNHYTIEAAVFELAELTKTDRKSSETDWAFQGLPWAQKKGKPLAELYRNWQEQQEPLCDRYLTLLDTIDRAVYAGYSMENHLLKNRTRDNVYLRNNPRFRFPNVDADEPLDQWLQSLHAAELISFAIGCMMGRFSLERGGLVYADSQGGVIDDLISQGLYGDFVPDQDAIVPLTYREWFDDDATSRFVDFLTLGWGEQHLHENLQFVAESLRMKVLPVVRNESEIATIRRYINVQFYQGHIDAYGKRPIYWLFSSGKHKAFECLVYLHRYNEKTLSRMRIEYVQPLMEKYRFHIDQLPMKIENATTMSESLQLREELKSLQSMQVEIQEFDDKLRHFADMRITLDLDDGVKQNYAKFGDLLSASKVINRGNHS